jgi:dihydrodipicolinate synthase/N-acetylneuraminate lyase
VLGSGDERLMTSYLVGSTGSQVSLACVVPELVVGRWTAAEAGDWGRRVRCMTSLMRWRRRSIAMRPTGRRGCGSRPA